jgi:hypothetical protein
MVLTTEESKPVVVAAEMESTAPTKMMAVAETPTTPKPTPTPLDIVQSARSEELDERSDNELSPRTNNSDNDNDAMKYGFGAGMRMYAKSLAMAEKQIASSPPVKKLTPVRKVDPVVIKPLSPTASATLSPKGSTLSPTASTLSPTASTLSPKASTLSPKASTLSPKASTLSPKAPKVETAATPVAVVASPKSSEPTLQEFAITTPAPVAAPAAVAVASPKTADPAAAATADEVAAVPVKSIACVNIVSQIQDFFGEFFRQTEDVVDDCHERVCNRETTHSCVSTAMKTVASTEQEDDEMVESSVAAELKEVAKEGEATTLSA